jgi:hypothetical protein
MTRGGLALAVLVASGCSEDDGPLARDTVASLARTPGDAIGYGRTGIYDARLSDAECDCPVVTLDLIGSASLCTLDIAMQMNRSIGIAQNDGVMVLRVDPVELSGPLDQDGTFSIGAVDSLTLLGGSGVRVSRIDGEFDENGILLGEYRQRIDGDFAEATVDCEESFSVEAVPR